MHITNWETFFSAEVAASAALVGLIFVGLSINLTRILSIPRLPNRALQSLIVLLTILFVSSLVLVPGQSVLLLGTEVLVAGLSTWTIVTLLSVSIVRGSNAQYRKAHLINLFLNQVAMLPYVIAGIIILVGNEGGLYWLVPAVIFSLIKAIADAWVLLVEINR